MIGLIGLAVAICGEIEGQLSPLLRPSAIALVTVAAALLSWKSHEYAGMFLNQKTLWSYTVEHNPGAFSAYNNLGVALLNSNQPAQALAPFNAAIRLQPTYPEPYNGLGNALFEMGQLPEAQAECEKALKHCGTTQSHQPPDSERVGIAAQPAKIDRFNPYSSGRR